MLQFMFNRTLTFYYSRIHDFHIFPKQESIWIFVSRISTLSGIYMVNAKNNHVPSSILKKYLLKHELKPEKKLQAIVKCLHQPNW